MTERFIRTILACSALVVLAAIPSQAQGPATCDSPGVQKVFGLSGSNVVYICCAKSADDNGTRRGTQVSISAISKASPAVITSTGHGFPASARPKVTISGATGTGWSAVNGTFTATVIDADTFSIAVDSTGFGTLGGTIVFTTTAPRTTVSEWGVQKLAYDGSNNLIWSGWLNGTQAFNQKCSDAASTSLNQQ